MSSMFKKKGGLAFKPKIPSGRARPAASAAPSQPLQPTKPPQSQVSIDSQSQSASEEAQQTTTLATPVVDSSAAKSPELSEPPRRKSPTPPASNTESALPDQAPSDKQPEPETTSKETNIGQETATDESAPRPEATTLESVPTTEPEQVQLVAVKDASVPDNLRDEQQSDTTPPTEVSTPATQTRDDAGVTESSATPSGAPEPSSEATPQSPKEPRKRAAPKPRTRKQAAKATQEATGEEDESARPKKRQRKAAKDGAESTPKAPRKRRNATQTDGEGQTNKRRARSVTPEDSENQTVDLQQLKMSDLTKDLHIGKKFSRHDELRERERRARLKSKLGAEADGEREDSATPERPAPSTNTDGPPTSYAQAPASGPQFRIVDGQIVVDQSSLAVDRHARAAAALGDVETVEENDFTRLITSNSFMNTSKLKGPNIWSDSETELFYRGLRMFGTDFEIISKMFPGKQRRNIKLKFNREERHCPRLVDAALIGEKTIKIDIDEYKAFTGSEFEPVASIEAEQRKRQEDFEAAQQRVIDEQAEIMRKKREELFAEDEDDVAKKKKGKKGKQKVIYGMNGEPITTES
ncbi:hypothetical protein QQZ08_003379 [Neonectria magnoliae]|uniref:SANT domain-containing protein n=1 Tax=Neonectria magnoliae TaxID=2732573 RepID=A0ABR1I8W6_9HYPO